MTFPPFVKHALALFRTEQNKALTSLAKHTFIFFFHLQEDKYCVDNISQIDFVLIPAKFGALHNKLSHIDETRDP